MAHSPPYLDRVFRCCRRKAACSTGVPLGRADTIGLLLVFWIAAHRVRLGGARRRRRGHRRGGDCASAAVPGDARSSRAILCDGRGRRRARAQHRVSRPGVHAHRSTTRLRARRARFPPGVLQRPHALQFHAARPARSPVPGVCRRLERVVVGRRQAPTRSSCMRRERRRRSQSTRRRCCASHRRRASRRSRINLTEGWHRLHVDDCFAVRRAARILSRRNRQRRAAPVRRTCRCARSASTAGR